MDLSGGADPFMIAAICILAIISKLISGLITGIVIHGSALAGIEIWGNTISRGEFSIALAALYGSGLVATTIAVMVIVTSIVGSFTAKYCSNLRRGILNFGRRAPLHRPHTNR
jgi:CPA2 family monovalent cation:H+ antiporter-2